MGYILANAEELDRQNIPHGNVLPDGRAIINMSMLRVMGSMKNIEFISSEAEVREKLVAMGYGKPQGENAPESEQSQENVDQIPTEGGQDSTEPVNPPVEDMSSQSTEAPTDQSGAQMSDETLTDIPETDTNLNQKVNNESAK